MSANPPTSNPLLTLLDVVDSPLLLFNPEGQVVFTNRAAKRMDARPAMSLPGDPNVRQLVQQIGQNKTVLQLDINVEINSDQGIARLKCQCAAKPIAGLIAMAISEVPQDTASSAAPTEVSPAAPSDRLSIQQIVTLIGSELRLPMEAVLTQMTAVAPAKEQEALSGALLTLKEKLARLTDMVTVFGEDLLIGDERMMVQDMVRSICQDLSPTAQAQGVKFILEGDRADLPPVYGSRKLMLRALHECLDNAVRHSYKPGRGDLAAGVRISFASSGHHLVMNIVNMGVLNQGALSRHATAIFQAESLNISSPSADTPVEMHIGLPLTHRILELHGGRLRIDDADGELDVMLELPTGAPLRNTHHLDLLQAQIYAEDLSTLMARGRSRSTQ